MKIFTFAVDFGVRSIEKESIRETEKEAHADVWQQLSEEAKNACQSIECIDECEVIAA